jgi:hypothetical protein
MAAHHRFAWRHPFTDGNGHAARLHTHLGLNSLGLTQTSFAIETDNGHGRVIFRMHGHHLDCSRDVHGVMLIT